MAVTIPVRFRKSVAVPAASNQVYDYLANIEKTIPAHFPGVEKFINESDNQYRWQFEKVSYAGYQFAFLLVTQFVFSPSTRIEIVPVRQPGTSSFSGKWEVIPVDSKTQINFEGTLEAELPIPFFAKAMAAPLVEREIGKLFERYLTNVATALTK